MISSVGYARAPVRRRQCGRETEEQQIEAAVEFGGAVVGRQDRWLNELIAGTDLQTFYGPIKFASEGDHFHNNTALDPMLVQIQGGQVKAIAPPDSAEAKIIYPLPPLS